MFWSGNFIAVRELNSLLKEENITLTQVLEADDILQECKADNKALIQFLTKPDILAELITLITEEPPKNVELANQYRHATMACEVLTSQLSTISDRLSQDTEQMNRLCDFIAKEPPLNPLLASYFSKTVEMLLERSPKQDCYLYHIVCLRVLDFFVSQRDFLPNLLRHISTSAIADTFKYFIRLDDVFSKIVMEWLDEHQFLDSLIQIICGTYPSEPPPVLSAPRGDTPEKGQRDASEKSDPQTILNHKEEGHQHTERDAASNCVDNEANQTVEADSTEIGERANATSAASAMSREEEEEEVEKARGRVRGVASANAAGLLWDLIMTGCAADGCTTRPGTGWALVARLQGPGAVRALLQGVFTSPSAARDHALLNGCQVLLALLSPDTLTSGEGEGGRASVEASLAPHLPLLHQALLQGPRRARTPAAVGAARVLVAALLAQLAASEVEDVATTMLALGTPGLLVDMFFKFENNNFLHAQVYSFIKTALDNPLYRVQYAKHLFLECDILTRLSESFVENETKKVRPGVSGHVVAALRCCARALDATPAPDAAGGSGGGAGPPAPNALRGAMPERLLAGWDDFVSEELRPVLRLHDAPLGGYYPSENTYEEEIMADPIDVNYDLNELPPAVEMDDAADDVDVAAEDDHDDAQANSEPAAASSDTFDDDGDDDQSSGARNTFMELLKQKIEDGSIWGESNENDAELDAALDVLRQGSPWESGAEGAGGGEGAEGVEGAGGEAGSWAVFGADTLATLAPADPFFFTYWRDEGEHADKPADQASQTELEESVKNMGLEPDPPGRRLDDASSVELANNLLTAMSSMTPDAIANIVNANAPPPHPLPPVAPTSVPTATPPAVPTAAPPADSTAAPPADSTAAPPADSTATTERDDTSER